jgi:hypothetical protein
MRTIRIVELATHRIASEIHTSDEAYRDGIMRTARLAIENGTEPNDIIW